MSTKIKIKNLYYLLSYAWDCIDLGADSILGNDDFDNTTNLFAKLLEASCQYLIRRGVSHDYVRTADELHGIKGKLDLAKSIKSGQLLFAGRTTCEIDQFTPDILINQIIKGAISTLLRADELSDENRRRLKHFSTYFSNVSHKQIGSDLFSKVKVNALTRHLHFVLELARLIHENTVISSDERDLRIKNFLMSTMKMNSLFERFLREFYRREVNKADVSSSRLRWQVEQSSDELFLERVPSLLTDISIVSNQSVVVIDAKYYEEALISNQRGSFKYRRDHLSQIMEYLRASNRKFGRNNSFGILLYPAAGSDINNFGSIEGYPIRVATVDLSKPWTEIKSKLISLYESAHLYSSELVQSA